MWGYTLHPPVMQSSVKFPVLSSSHVLFCYLETNFSLSLCSSIRAWTNWLTERSVTCELYKWWDTKCILSLYSAKPILLFASSSLLPPVSPLAHSVTLWMCMCVCTCIFSSCFLVHCGSFSLVSHTLFVFAFMQCFIRENRLALNRWSFKSSLFLSSI